MNKLTIVRYEADATGVKIRCWIEDAHTGRHLTVAEGLIEEKHLIQWARAIAHEQNRGAQYMLRFDD